MFKIWYLFFIKIIIVFYKATFSIQMTRNFVSILEIISSSKFYNIQKTNDINAKDKFLLLLYRYHLFISKKSDSSKLNL